MILHLVARVEWDSKQTDQSYAPNAFAKDGFIHCTQGDLLLLRVANAFYKNTPGDFLAVGIDETKVTAPVKWEAASSPATAVLPSAGSGSGGETPPEVIAEYGDAIAGAVVDPSSQPSPPRVEGAGVLFPHIYGPLNRDAIMGIRRVVRDADGSFIGFAPLEDAPHGMNLKKPSELAHDLVQATGDFSDALARYKDRIEARMDELDKNIKDKLDQ